MKKHGIILGLGAIALACVPGCTPTPRANVSPSAGGGSSASGPDKTRIMPDLTKTINYMQYAGGGGDASEPLNVARMLGRSAGGSWVVFAPKPLDDVKMSQTMDYSNRTVEALMEGMQSAGTPLAWDTSRGYLLVDFASKDDLARIKANPPVETVGVFARGETDSNMLQALADAEHIKITADDALLKQRAAFRDARNAKDDDDDTQDDNSQLSLYQRMAGTSSAPSDAPEFKVVEKLDLPGLLRRLGEYYAGEFTNTSGNEWQLKPLTDPRKIQTEIARIKQPIDEAASNAAGPFTSFAERQNPGSVSAEEREQAEEQALNTPLDSDVISAFDTLGSFGAPAIPALTGYLDLTKPQYAIAAIQTLGAMSQPQAKAALSDFEKKVSAPPAGVSQAARSAVQKALLRELTRGGGDAAVKMLGDAAVDKTTSASARMSARLKLLKMGALGPLTVASPARTLPPGCPNFTLPPPVDPSKAKPAAQSQPQGAGAQIVSETVDASIRNVVISAQAPSSDASGASSDPSAVTPIATVRSKDGDIWAVFVSGYYGGEQDVWLARAHGGVWSEYIFTGEQFPSGQRFYAVSQTPSPGACRLTVDGDKVVMSPPKGDPAAALAALQKKMNDPKVPADQRSKLMSQYGQLQQNSQGSMSKTLTFSLAALRKDSDGDGLPDVVEKRLGTDPLKADTDGDGIPDEQDANPLAAPAKGDRATLLQTVFTGLFGKDPSTVPIVVVLDKPYFQEFLGANARVLCMTKDDYKQRMADLTGYRLLQFTGPSDADATILTQDGPCLFNDARTRAEVHFFFLNDMSSQSMMGLASILSGQGANMDYIALFDRDGDWKLKSIKPWKFDTAMQSYIKYMQTEMGAGTID